MHAPLPATSAAERGPLLSPASASSATPTPSPRGGGEAAGSGSSWRSGPLPGLLVGFGPMLLLILLAAYHRHRVMVWLARFGDWLRGRGALGMAIYLLAFALFLVACGPSTPFELVGGFVYPLWWALALNALAKWAGSVLCFLIARRCGSATRRLLHGGSAAAAAGAALPPILSSLDSLLVTHEYRALMLSRFAMLPFSVKNYGLGALPSVRLYPFAITCFFGDLPFTVAFAYAGHSVKSLVDVAEGRETAMGGRSSMAIMLISVLGTVGLPLLLTRHAKGAMERAALQGTATAENMDAAAAGVAEVV